MIFQWSLDSGEVPGDEKLSNLPVFKKAKKEDPGSYRPVSLISVPGKILEIILRVFKKLLKDSVVMGDSQHRFTK